MDGLGGLHDGFMGAIVIVVSREMLTGFETRGKNRQDATVTRSVWMGGTLSNG